MAQNLQGSNDIMGPLIHLCPIFQQQIRGITPVPQNPAVLPHHPAAASATTTQKGSIVAGYPVRTQASSATYPPASSQVCLAFTILKALSELYF